MTSIQVRLRRRLLISISLTSSILLFVVSIFGGLEFREADQRRLAHIAQIVLGLSASMPSSGVQALIDPDLYERLDAADSLVLVRRDGQEIYASPNLTRTSARPGLTDPQFKGDKATYDLLHVSDEALATTVTVGIASKEAVESLLEIALITTLCFLISAAILWHLSLRAIGNALSPLHVFANETRLRHSGNLVPLDIHKTPEELADVTTALNSLMEKLDTALDQERKFVSNAAHELRTPLAGIVAQIDAIPNVPECPETAAALDKIRTAAMRSNRMVSQLLSHARAMTLQDNAAITSRFDLRDLAQEVVANCTQSAIEASVDLGVEFRISDADAVVEYPYDLLQIVVENLVDNAVKYCGRPGIVTVTVSRPDNDHLRLCVEDNGQGLKSTEFSAALARFERMGTQVKQGYGLGLSLVSDLSKRLDFDLEAYHSPLGGLGVRFDLKRAAPKQLGKT